MDLRGGGSAWQSHLSGWRECGVQFLRPWRGFATRHTRKALLRMAAEYCKACICVRLVKSAQHIWS